MSRDERISIGDAARWACILEVCAPKAGNVHPQANFADATFKDFIRSGQAIAPVLERATDQSVGQTIFECVLATRSAVGHNTNLGIILLFAPLCAVRRDEQWQAGVDRVLMNLSLTDAQLTFEAIRIAKPGGLGDAPKENVRSAPTAGLREIMMLAAHRDAIARQYAQGFVDVTGIIADDVAAPGDRCQRIVLAHLGQMAREPDSLIARKCGAEVARESSRLARQVLNAGWPGTKAGVDAFAGLDRWLRDDGHRKNPGTSADLIAAGLFVALRDGRIGPPFDWVQRWLQ